MALAPRPSSHLNQTSPDEGLGKPASGWRRSLFGLIFESDTRAGRLFDLVLIAVIVMSVAVVMLDSVRFIHDRIGHVLAGLEWGITAVFTVEYFCRLASVRHPLRYALSFYGLVDLLALLPAVLVAYAPEYAYLMDVRILRLLRVFRIFKLSRYAMEYRALSSAVLASRRKIAVFVGFVTLVVLVMGTLMYAVEGPANGYTSIPVAIYWAISTMSTVGFGDLVPKTDAGRGIASLMMLLGWGILAVPTGIVTAELARGRPVEASALADSMPATRSQRRSSRESSFAVRRRCLLSARTLRPGRSLKRSNAPTRDAEAAHQGASKP